MWCAPSGESSKELSHLHRSVLLGLFVSFRPITWFLPPHLTYPGPLPGVHYLSDRMESQE